MRNTALDAVGHLQDSGCLSQLRWRTRHAVSKEAEGLPQGATGPHGVGLGSQLCGHGNLFGSVGPTGDCNGRPDDGLVTLERARIGDLRCGPKALSQARCHVVTEVPSGAFSLTHLPEPSDVIVEEIPWGGK